MSNREIKTGHAFKQANGEIVHLTLKDIFKDRNRGYDDIKKMKEVQNKWTQPIKDKGYIIEYSFADGFYSSFIYLPYRKDEGVHYVQDNLNDFYYNMYINFINK